MTETIITWVTMCHAAKYVGMSSNRKLFAFLRDKRILNAQNIPYLHYREAGYFRSTLKTHTRGYGAHQYAQTLVSEKGLSFISELLDDPGKTTPTVCSTNTSTENPSRTPSATG